MRYIFLVVFSLLMHVCWSGEGSWSHRVDLEEVITGVDYAITDRAFNGQDVIDFQSYEGLVFLEYTRKLQSDLTQVYDWEIRVTYEVDGVLQTDPLVISSITGNYVYADFAKVLNVNGLLGYKVKVIDIEGDWYDSQGVPTTVSDPEDDVHFPDDIDLRLELRSERWFDLDVQTASAELLELQFDANTYRADWSFIEGAELYDFEWVWIDDKSTEAADIAGTSGSFAYEKPFELKEPVRVRLWKTHHVLDETYETGTIYFRVRPVSKWVDGGVLYNDIKEGEWTYFTLPDNFDPSTGSYILSTVVSHDITAGHENDKNWAFSTSYAEDGKSVSSIAFYDGSNRGRQSLSYNTSDDVTLVGESFHDNEGRQTVSVIPAPIAGRQLGYQQDFNLVSSNNVFDESDIDFQNYLSTPSPTLSNLSGAAQYFSSNNDFLDDLFRDAIPESSGYVYSQTIYRNDGSGRIERVGGIGKEFQVNGDHAIRTFYVSPTHYELKRLFGENVPDDIAGYRKEIVQDANGQYSVTYFDKRGNVIATGLMGNAPDNLIELENANSMNVTTDILSNNAQVGDYQMISEHTHVPTYENASVTLTYDLGGIVNQINGQTITLKGQQVTIGDMCATCEYDLLIEVVDQNGLPVYPNGTSTHYEASIDASGNCYDGNGDPISPAPQGVSHNSGALVYQLGDIQEYRIIKTLTVDTEAMMEAFEDQLSLASWNDLGAFVADYTATIDYSDCFTNCDDYCEYFAQYQYEIEFGPGSWAIAPQATRDAKIDDCLLDACDQNEMNENFDPTTSGTFPTVNPWEQNCQSQLALMVEQIMPGHIFYDNQTSWFWSNLPNPAITTNNPGGYTHVQLMDPTFMTEEIAEELVLEGYHREYCHYELCAQWAESMNYSSSLIQFYDPGDAYNFGVIADPINAPNAYTAPWTSNTSVASQDPFLSHPADSENFAAVLGTLVPAGLDGSASGTNNLQWAVEHYNLYNPTAISTLTTNCTLVGTITTLESYVNELVTCLAANSTPTQSTQYYDGMKEFAFRSIYDQIKLELMDYYKQLSIHTTSGNNNVACDYFTDNYTIFVQTSVENIDPFIDDFLTDFLGGGIDCHVLAYNATLDWLDMMPEPCLTALGANGLYDATFTESSLVTNSSAGGSAATTLEQLYYDYVIDFCPENTYAWFYDPNDISNPAQNDYDAIVAMMNNSSVIAQCGNESVLDWIEIPSPPTYSINYTNVQCLEALIEMINVEIQNIDYTNVPDNYNVTITSSNYPFLADMNGCGLDNETFNFNYAEINGEPSTRINNSCLSILFVNSNSTVGGYITYLSNPEFHASYMIGGMAKFNVWVMQALLSDGSITEVYLDDKTCPLTYDETISINGLGDLLSYTYDPQDCMDETLLQAQINATTAYNQMLDDLRSNYLEVMQSCITSATEKFSMKYELKEYQYTLFYYDLVNNLVQTVPPQGVDLVPTAAFGADGLWISGHVEANPNHKMETRYQYNGLGTLIAQYTPDGGHSDFIHDELYRVRYSQNSRQKSDLTASYTKYDELGRVVEAGEFYLGTTNNNLAHLQANAGDNNYPQIGLDVVMDHTQTYYEGGVSFDPTIAALFEGGEQKNLRNAIGAVYHYEAVYDATGQPVDGTKAETAISYSYDPHKNVSQSISTNYLLEGIGHQHKGVEYEYDLISGNVNEVIYQRGEADEYHHQYHYDANNRLVRAYTSRNNGDTWDQDAKYFYYLHGPLARVEIGEDHIQGTDYAYNLLGWLKGVNSNVLISSRDIGKDGNSGDNQFFGVDAYGFSLGYYGDGAIGGIGEDYKSITLGFEPFANTSVETTANNGAMASLFNGNISNMVTALRNLDEDPVTLLLNNYKYDQLQRIKNLDVYYSNTLSDANYNFDDAFLFNSGAYSANYSFDGNGNLLSLQRYGDDGTLMDNLKYAYYQEGEVGTGSFTTGMQQIDNSNRLSFVDDSEDYGVEDLKPGQVAGNFDYDESGQLIQDNQEGIEEIVWSVTGKVKEIHFTQAAQTSGKEDIRFIYDPMDMRIAKQVFHSCNDITTTFYTYEPSGNVMATYKLEQKVTTGQESWTAEGPYVEYFTLAENMIYGSSRLGIDQRDMLLYTGDITIPSTPLGSTDLCINTDYLVHDNATNYTYDRTNREVRLKYYEFSNHLGNVLEVVTDRKITYDDNGMTTYTADIVSFSDYYPYGMLMPSTYNEDEIIDMPDCAELTEVQMVNDQFDTEVEDWVSWGTTNTVQIEWDSGKMHVISPDRYRSAVRHFETVPNQTYTVELDIDIGLLGSVSIGHYNTQTLQYTGMGTITSSGVHQFTFTANSTISTVAVQFPNEFVNLEYWINYFRVTGPKKVNTCDELYVINDDFSSTQGGWIARNSPVSLTVQNGGLTVEADSRGDGIKQTITTVIGTEYLLKFTLSGIDEGAPVAETERVLPLVFDATTNTKLSTSSYYLMFQDGSAVLRFTATSTSTRVEFYAEALSTFTARSFTVEDVAVLSYGTGNLVSVAHMARHGQESNGYRYGFQGQEMDDDVKGKGNSINYKYRMHDPRIGRFFARDPLAWKYPYYTPYQFSGNRLIDAHELEGLEPQTHNSVETDEPFNKGVMQYDLASEYNIIPSGTQSASENFDVGMYNVQVIRHPESGDILAYIAAVPGMILDYVDPEKGRVYLQNQVRYDWVISPDQIDDFKSNIDGYELQAAAEHNYGKDFSLKSSTLDFIKGDYAAALGKEWKAAIKNPLFWIQVVGGTIVARGSKGGSTVKTTTTTAARSTLTSQKPKISTWINPGKQGKHIIGHNNYKLLKSNGKTPSVLSADAQTLLDDFHNGNIVSSQKVNSHKTRVDFGQTIGDYVNPETGIATPTTNGIISNSQTGAHIVPAAPN